MKDKKLFLYMALGIVLFALWNAWQVDYKKPLETKAVVAQSTPAATSQLTSKEAATALQQNLPAPETRLINISTDVLNVAIDTQGGNIVSASLLHYPSSLHSKTPEKLLSDDPTNYYVTRSELKSALPKFDESNVQYKTEKKTYALGPKENFLVVKLVAKNKGLVINKIFTFSRKKYDVSVNYEIENKTKETWVGELSASITRKAPSSSGGPFGFNTFSGAAISSAEKPYEKISYSSMEKSPVDKEIMGGWLAMQQRYFLSAWIPEQTKTYRYYSKTQDKTYTIGFSGGALSVPAGKTVSSQAKLYIGPEITENLKPLAKGLDLTIDYGWLWVISVLLFWVMKKIYFLVGNWGWAIILVTVLIKLVFYKLSETSCRSMAKMKELAPKLQALKERYGEDKQKLSHATMELYKKERINPLGGCLPMLVQIPFFIALYYVLMSAVELRQAPFVLWIHDLSVKDPYYILPILMGLSMLLQQKLSPTTPDPAQARMMLMMPIIFTVFFLSFPSGLVLYWLANSCLSILQQWHINKKICVVRGPHKK